MLTKSIYVLVLFIASLSFAEIVISGDGGEEFVVQKSKELCETGNVQAVYTCIGNVVRTISSVSGEGSTFYKPDGRVIHCPVATPGQIGAECVQLMSPNFCFEESECGVSPPLDTFPGQNDAPEQTGDVDHYIVEEEVEEEVPAAQEEEPEPQEEVQESVLVKKESSDVPTVKTNLDSPLAYLSYVILLLGIACVVILFLLFKKSLAE